MMSRVIKDYFTAFRWSNFREKVANTAYMIVYFTTMLPIIIDVYDSIKDTLIYYAVLLPVVHTLNSACLHIMRMPKLMYMLPLSREMKREYIVKSGIFRICFCSGVGVVCTLPLLLLESCHIFTYLLIVYNLITWSLIFCGMNERYNIEEREAWPKVAKSDCRGVIQGVNVFFTAMALIGLASMLFFDDGQVNVYANLLFAVPALIIQLPLTIKHMSYWNTAVEKAMSYETSYDK